MTKEQIDKLHALEGQRFDLEKRLSWMDSWGEILFAKKEDETEFFTFAIFRRDERVFQRPANRAEVEEMFYSERARLFAELSRIDSEIDAL